MVLENKKRRQRYEEFLKELRRRFRKGKSRIVIFVSHGYQPYKLRLISRKQSDRKGRLYIEYRSIANGFFVIIWFCRRLFVIDEKRRKILRILMFSTLRRTLSRGAAKYKVFVKIYLLY